MVLKDEKVKLELLARRVITVLLVQWVFRVLWVHEVFREKEVDQDLKDLPVLAGLLVPLVCQVQRVHLV